MKTCALFGHRIVLDNDLENKLYSEIEKLILKGTLDFLIGSHGDFDKLALSVCKKLKKKYQINITIVFTTLNAFIKKDFDLSRADCYCDINTKVYDIENIHFKKKIIVSNQKMVNESDIVVCYINSNKNYGGAIKVLEYATKLNKPIINLYKDLPITWPNFVRLK